MKLPSTDTDHATSAQPRFALRQTTAAAGMSNDKAISVAQLIADPSAPPFVREASKRDLLAYFKQLLSSNPLSAVPTPRRWK